MLTFGTLSLLKITWVEKIGETKIFMKNNKTCGKLRKGANFVAAKKSR